MRGGGCNHADVDEGDVEFFGNDLRERGDDALADFDFARERFDVSVAMELEPLRELAIDAQAPRERRARRDATRGIEREIHRSTAEARSTARTMRLWLPQRQRLPSNAAFTSASLGRGVRESSAAALISMPEVQ